MQLIPTGEADKPRNQFPPVQVGERLIPESDIAAELQHHPAAEVSAAWHEAARSLVIRELLLQRATALGLSGDDEEQRIAGVLERELEVPEPSEDDCRRFYEANRHKFHSPTVLAASHILLAAAPDDVDGRLQQEDLGRMLLQQLREEPLSFEAVARQHSACESRNTGGSLGQLVRGQTVREFENKVWGFAEGLAPDLVESRYGWHIVRIDQRLEGEPLPFDAARPMVRHQLLESVSRRALRQYVQVLAMETGVSGVDLELPDSPLMQ
ncbi:peptidylprolyl isomerase [Marinobacter mobilis]|uniref:peptidylprolyl isomerase n=1 Tax=Marinobacter mobilis TaxID=488533 RepID=A0A1H2R7I8_9GAMM|nr:peptidylprolyl isomerase [Marinobacter mobilis]SDW15367.1 peptidyl-prolyl cis-trans isomerase C [Marinobacter mobilis]